RDPWVPGHDRGALLHDESGGSRPRRRSDGFVQHRRPAHVRVRPGRDSGLPQPPMDRRFELRWKAVRLHRIGGVVHRHDRLRGMPLTMQTGPSTRGWTIVLLLVVCSSTCPERFGKQHLLLFVTPLADLTDGGQMEVTIPQHWGGADSVHSCKVWDFDFDNTQIEVT